MSVKLEMSKSDDLPPDSFVPAESDCKQWAESALQRGDEVIASVQIVTADEMQQLNRDYRGKDKPTNVLSFPMDVPQEIGLNLLGDLVLCAQVIADEAAQQNKPLQAHWAHMIVHGMLHLQGYDHIEEHEAEHMEALEIDILQTLGFPDPYQTQQ